MIFGVKNEPRVVLGLDDPQRTISKITEIIKVRIDPAPRYQVRQVEIEGKLCVDLEVQNGPAYPYYYAADGVRIAYVRRGDQSEEATTRELNELIFAGHESDVRCPAKFLPCRRCQFYIAGSNIQKSQKRNF